MKSKLTERKYLLFLLVIVLVIGLGGISTVTAETSKATVIFTQTEDNKLELTTVPSIDFGTNNLPTGEMSYNATSISGPLKITDTTGDYTGWEVTGSLSNFAAGTVNNSMPGASIKLVSGSAAKDGGGTGANPPSVGSNIELVSGGSDDVSIASADPGEGTGVWNVTWTTSNVTLEVPNIPTKGTNEATITWQITAGP